ncbi:T9SS type A sorting domain-containing protein [Parabacteroides sp. FAFU027]|uniref:T9SS type A sorting domain-containing protein n=1 Tax=Parabacteroides sp. FAFU027 TaxID=2922715 RepID=UPI001FAF0721|nr:T9SS type A sorting domain-containing protein [Parabacteroides sp. FAFU027]
MKTLILYSACGLLRLVNVIMKSVSKHFSFRLVSVLILSVGSTIFQSAVAQEVVKSVRLQVASGSYVDELYIGFFTNASDGYDAYDSEKMDNGPSYPEIWTYADGVHIVINGFAPYTGYKQVPVGFQAGQTGSFSIKATEILNFDPGTTVILTDNKTGTSQDLTVNPIYNFTSNTETSDRFTLTISTKASTTTTTSALTGTSTSTVDPTSSGTTTSDSNSTILNSTQTSNTITGYTILTTDASFPAEISTDGSAITLTFKDSKFIGMNATLYTMYGKNITSTKITDLVARIGSNLKKGIYIVEIKSKNQKWTQKVSL